MHKNISEKALGSSIFLLQSREMCKIQKKTCLKRSLKKDLNDKW